MKTLVPYKGADYTVTAYQERDLETGPVAAAINVTATMWRDRCQKYLDTQGDRGTCVLGAGIEIYYLPKRCRFPKSKMVIPVYQVVAAQGSLVWEESVEDILAHLKSKGVEASYNPGRMD
jgi:hypothetical protein